MTRALDNAFVLTYAQKPDDAVVARANALHQRVRLILRDQDFLTFLQGSYSNDTALANMNDVDIVAVRRGLRGGPNPALGRDMWKLLFSDIEDRLQQEPHFRGRWKREDKCIRLASDVKIDIVPAIALGNDPAGDPIAIYSFQAGREKKNWPHGHHARGRKKSDDTHGHYKQVVRLYKRWRTSHFSSPKVAPSYYLECLLYSLPNNLFVGDLATNFVAVAQQIGRLFPNPQAWSTRSLPRIEGGGNLLSPDEWEADAFEQFRVKLAQSLPHAARALTEPDNDRARKAWKAAFNGQ
jgi:hypothetical protein